MKQQELFENCGQHGHCLKTYRGFSLRKEDETLLLSCAKWMTAGIVEHGVCWTHNGSEWPSAEEGSSACSLASILEPNAAPKYFLSARACAGILRRAEKRGKSLPASLQAALEQVARGTSGTKDACKSAVFV
jgi:hypothetical protein